MTIEEIKNLQEQYDLVETQSQINSGQAWLMDGKTGRRAMQYLKSGACYLPLKEYYDYWGNHIPSRTKVPKGTSGSLKNSQLFWSEKEKYTAYFSKDENAWGEYIMSQIEKRKSK